MVVGDVRDDAAFYFLWPWRGYVARVQPRFDMADRNAPVIGRQRGRHYGGGIALDDDAIGFFGVEHVTDSGEQPCGQPVERLARFHQVEIHVGSEPGDVEHLIEQPAMLRRPAIGRAWWRERGSTYV